MGDAVRYAPALHIEQGGDVQLSDRSPVGTPHVVGVDLQLRVGFYAGGIGQQDVVVFLVGFDLLGVFFDDDLAVETGRGNDRRQRI